MPLAQPVIGLTLDHEPAGGWSRYPWYAIRENYCAALARAGGLALALPHVPAQAEAYADLLDGVVVTGGAFDVDPALFGDSTRHAAVSLKARRTEFELALARATLARNKPVLGICGGEQLLNVALGGSLIQHIPDEVAGALAHEQPNPRHEPGHEVRLIPGGRLAAICGRERMAVNSAHHQAVKELAPGVRVGAIAPDGVIEAIEHPGYRFCLGVQWHPEFEIDPGDVALLRAFVAACAGEETAAARAG